MKFIFKTDASSQSSLEYINEKRWEDLLRSFISLKNFSCCIELPIQTDNLINTFEQNQYFLERNWQFSFQVYTYSFNTILRIHTKPYPKRRLDIMYMIIYLIYCICLFIFFLSFSPSKAFVDNTDNIYFGVRDLRILIDAIPLPILSKFSRIIYNNVTTLTLISNKTFNEQIFLNYLRILINPNNLNYLIIQLDNCSKNFLLNLLEKYSKLYSLTISTYHSWSKLLQLSSNVSKSSLRSLNVYENFTNFNQYDSIYELCQQLKILSIIVPSIDDCYRFLTLLFIGNKNRKSIEKLRSLTIKCDFDEPDTIANWVRTNILRKLSYKCTTSALTIWL